VNSIFKEEGATMNQSITFNKIKSKFLQLATLSFAGLTQIKNGMPINDNNPLLYGISRPDTYSYEPNLWYQIYNFIIFNFSWLLGLIGAFFLA
jgi:hypothetical protein